MPAVRIDFNSSDEPTLGVEWEVELVGRASGDLVCASSQILDDLARAAGTPNPKVKHELFECTVEIVTDICKTVAHARSDLSATVRELHAAAGARGMAVMCAGSHPFSLWADQLVSPDPRYHELVERMQWPARRLQIFGVHFHIGVRSAEKAIAIANALTGFIPHLLALSASSPYWMGHDTGLASSRSKVFESLPTAGLPFRLADWAEFEEFMGTLIGAGAIQSIREVWWDIRPHPDFGTVEVRICDGIPTLREVCALAALSQCLVEWLDTLLDRGYRLPVPREWVVRENKWRAARHGLDTEIIVDEAGRMVPLRLAVQDLVEELAPASRRLDCTAELADVLTILETGPSYLRQRRTVAAGGTLQDVVTSLVEELETDTPR
jgi:carboxylate-amine ligase